MRKLFIVFLWMFWAVGVFWAVMNSHAQTVVTTEWVGSPVVSTGSYPAMGWLPDYEVGLRSDGVVVWRKKEVKP